MSNDQQSTADTWLNQTQLGRYFGLTAVGVGRKLAELGLKGENKLPTARALQGGYCRPHPLRDGTPFFLWHKEDVCGLLRAAGLQQLSREEADAYQSAQALLAAARKAHKTGDDRLFCLLAEEIPDSQYEYVNTRLEQLGSSLKLW